MARELAQQARALCFDEFQVTDVADAMILRRLLEGFLQVGLVRVIASKCISLSLCLYPWIMVVDFEY